MAPSSTSTSGSRTARRIFRHTGSPRAGGRVFGPKSPSLRNASSAVSDADAGKVSASERNTSAYW